MKRLALTLVAALALLAGCGTTSLPEFQAETDSGPVIEVPGRVEIPALGASSTLMDLHLDEAGALEAPPLDGDPMQAGWYADGVKPGETGPAVVAAHVNAHGDPGLFKNLHTLAVGEPVYVDDLTFIVDRVEQYDKDEFPTDAVYSNTERPELRLITCGGDFDHSEHSYEDNIVVFATLE